MKKRNPKQQFFVYLLFLGVSLVVVLLMGVYVRNVQIAAQESSALYGGQLESAYPSAGFLVGYENAKPSELCGIVYLNSSTAISAAHCLDKANSFTSGIGTLTTETSGMFTISGSVQHPNWDHSKSGSDVAKLVVGTQNTSQLTGISAQIAKPRQTCDYRLIAYGRTENDEQSGLSLTRDRKGSDVCITYVDDSLIYLNSARGGICVGDSGSPVFEKNTNHVVGIISAIIVKDKQEPCYIGNTAIAVRLDAKRDFIEGTSVIQPTPTAQITVSPVEFSEVTFSSDTSLLEGAQKFLVKNATVVEIVLFLIGGIIAFLLTLAIFRKY